MDNSASTIDAPEKPLPLPMQEKLQTLASAVEKKDLSALGKALQFVVYPFSALTGLYTGYINVRNSAYDNVKWTGALNDEKNDYTRKMFAEGEKARNALASGHEFDFPAATKTIAKIHDRKITDNLTKLKVGTLPKQWGVNSLYQKQNAILAAATATGIGVAVGAMITDSKKFREWFSSKTEGQEQAR